MPGRWGDNGTAGVKDHSRPLTTVTSLAPQILRYEPAVSSSTNAGPWGSQPSSVRALEESTLLLLAIPIAQIGPSTRTASSVSVKGRAGKSSTVPTASAMVLKSHSAAPRLYTLPGSA